MTAYLGDFAEDATLVFKFNTVGQDFAPITLGSGAVSVYKQGSTTESTAGVTLVTDYDSVTGLHQVTIDTSADAFYETGKDYTALLSAGAADGVSLVGRQLRQFSIRNRTVYAYDSSGNAIPTVSQIASAVRDVSNASPAAGSLGEAVNEAANSATSAVAYVTTVLSRLGAFTGTGVNTVLGFLKAIMSKDASTPSDVGGTFAASTDSLEAIRDRGDTSWVTGGSLSGSISQGSIANGGTLNLRLGDDYVAADGRAKSFSVTGVVGDWSAGTAKLRMNAKGTSAADITATSLTQVSTTITMAFDIPRTAFAALRPTDSGKWEIFIELGSGARFVTPIEGVLDLDAEIPPAA